MYFDQAAKRFQAWFSSQQLNEFDFTFNSISTSDAEFLAVIANHWIGAKISRNNSKVVSCEKLMEAFCQKFIREGVAHD